MGSEISFGGPVRGPAGNRGGADRQERIDIRYGTESDLRQLGQNYGTQLDAFMSSLHISDMQAARVRERAIGALSHLNDIGQLTPEVHFSIALDSQAPDGVRVTVRTDRSGRAIVRPAASDGASIGEADGEGDIFSSLVLASPFHRPAWRVLGDPDEPRLEIGTAGCDEEELGVSAASSGSSAGFSRDRERRPPHNSRGIDQGDDDGPSTLKAAKTLAKKAASALRDLFGLRE